LLTEEEKRANHIESEKKRRLNIKVGFDQLVELVPSLTNCHRSEALILEKSVEHVRYLLRQREELMARLTLLRKNLGDASADEE
ncbi:Myc-type, basic helix-loop-helix domain-containing protein, partial [Cladochytrium replicatum]